MDHVDNIIDQWNRERPDLDVTPMGLVGRIVRLQTHLRQEMEKTFARHGLNFASFDVLATLRRSGPPYQLSPGKLIEMTMVTSGTMTNRIDQLAKAGWVERVKNPNDGRGFLVSLTDAGFKLIDAAVTDHVATITQLTAALPETERTKLTALLRDFLIEVESD